MPQPLRLPVGSQLLFLLTCRSARGGPTGIRYALEERVQVRTSAFTRKISIVRWGGKGDGFSCTSEHVRDRVSEALEPVRLELVFVVNDVVVCGADCPLKTIVRLKEEVEFCRSSVNLMLVYISPKRTHRKRQ